MDNYEAPRGAIWAANAFAWVIDKTGLLLDNLKKSGYARVEDCKTIPELRNYASQIQHHSPGVAADLLAAADRAELESK